MQNLKSDLQKELVENILPYWMNKFVDNENGGFYGQIDGREQLHPQANKGAILNARILWTFSAAYRVVKNPEYLVIAERAYNYIIERFIDKENGGVFWELDYLGKPVNTKKQAYAQGFALYGFSEFYRATGNTEALEWAKNFFHLIEKYCYDSDKGGYFEAFTRDWQPIEDMRLSEKDANEKKTMNTHLHILEPYTNLMRIWKTPETVTVMRNLIDVFTDKILNKKTNHLNLFFDENWECKSTEISYGHDIEASWLIFEAAEVLGDEELLNRLKPVCLNIANAAYEGLQPDGSLIYEAAPLSPLPCGEGLGEGSFHLDRDCCGEGLHLDRDRHWWVQAEAVVGSAYAYKISGNADYLRKAQQTWDYIKNYIIDRENGEWFWSAYPDGKPNRKDDKAGFWKCPYHNARMCLEVMCV